MAMVGGVCATNAIANDCTNEHEYCYGEVTPMIRIMGIMIRVRMGPIVMKRSIVMMVSRATDWYMAAAASILCVARCRIWTATRIASDISTGVPNGVMKCS